MKADIKRVVVCTHADPSVAEQALEDSLALLTRRGVTVLAPRLEWDKHGDILAQAGAATLIQEPQAWDEVGLCLVLGGDGTILRGFHLTRGHHVPVAGINLGRVGFLTTVRKGELKQGLGRLLDGEFVEYPILGLEAEFGSRVFNATNDVAIGRGGHSRPCSLALEINGVTLFEVLCDGVVVGTPAGSSAYSLAAGGPLLGISVDAYVITLVAAHAVGVRPVVAAPQDILDITNTHESVDCAVDIDGQREAVLTPGNTLRVRTRPASTSLALLEGDSLYHHFRDRLL